MNNTTNTDILKYISEIESLILLLKKELTQDLQEPTTQNFAPEKKVITFPNSSNLYDVFNEIRDTIDFYLDNIGFPNMGKKLSYNQMQFKTIKLFEKYNISSSLSMKIIQSLEFEKNITYDIFLKKIEDTITKKSKK